MVAALHPALALPRSHRTSSQPDSWWQGTGGCRASATPPRVALAPARDERAGSTGVSEGRRACVRVGEGGGVGEVIKKVGKEVCVRVCERSCVSGRLTKLTKECVSGKSRADVRVKGHFKGCVTMYCLTFERGYPSQRMQQTPTSSSHHYSSKRFSI